MKNEPTQPFTPLQLADIHFTTAGIIYLLKVEKDNIKLIKGLLECNEILRGIKCATKETEDK